VTHDKTSINDQKPANNIRNADAQMADTSPGAVDMVKIMALLTMVIDHVNTVAAIIW
jgi:hypothetical protein